MITREFVTAGDAIFTAQSITGERYTYRITKNDATDHCRESYFARILTGTNNDSDYTYLGLFSKNLFRVYPTSASTFKSDSRPMLVLNWALDVISGLRTLPDDYTICHEGRCGKCGRRLTVPESVETGLGPECAKAAKRTLAKAR